MAKGRTVRVFFEDKGFLVFDGVYEPAEDTYLLADNLEVEPSETVLDMGTGCGILAVISALKAKRVVAVDINPYAVRCAKVNADVNGVSEKTDILRGDLFGPLKEGATFDVILFNAPYLPTEDEKPRDWIEYAWSGGERGRTPVDRFTKHAVRHLKRDGRILLVQSTLSDVEQTLTAFKKRGFSARILSERKVAFETITLIEASPIGRRPRQKVFERSNR